MSEEIGCQGYVRGISTANQPIFHALWVVDSARLARRKVLCAHDTFVRVAIPVSLLLVMSSP